MNIIVQNFSLPYNSLPNFASFKSYISRQKELSKKNVAKKRNKSLFISRNGILIFDGFFIWQNLFVMTYIHGTKLAKEPPTEVNWSCILKLRISKTEILQVTGFKFRFDCKLSAL